MNACYGFGTGLYRINARCIETLPHYYHSHSIMNLITFISLRSIHIFFSQFSQTTFLRSVAILILRTIKNIYLSKLKNIWINSKLYRSVWNHECVISASVDVMVSLLCIFVPRHLRYYGSEISFFPFDGSSLIYYN